MSITATLHACFLLQLHPFTAPFFHHRVCKDRPSEAGRKAGQLITIHLLLTFVHACVACHIACDILQVHSLLFSFKGAVQYKTEVAFLPKKEEEKNSEVLSREGTDIGPLESKIQAVHRCAELDFDVEHGFDWLTI